MALRLAGFCPHKGPNGENYLGSLRHRKRNRRLWRRPLAQAKPLTMSTSCPSGYCIIAVCSIARSSCPTRAESDMTATRFRKPSHVVSANSGAPRLGGLREATIRQPRTGARLSRPLYPSRRVASRAEEYRRRAQQCLEMARAFGDRDPRVTLAHMAQAWLRWAHNCQDAKKVRPAVQQQQQIQPKDGDRE